MQISIIYEVGDIVELPFNETGKIVNISDKILWGFKYLIRIRKATFNKTNEHVEFKYEELRPIKVNIEYLEKQIQGIVNQEKK